MTCEIWFSFSALVFILCTIIARLIVKYSNIDAKDMDEVGPLLVGTLVLTALGPVTIVLSILALSVFLLARTWFYFVGARYWPEWVYEWYEDWEAKSSKKEKRA